MINDRLSELRDYPFGRLNALLDGIDPAPGAGPDGASIIMSIGEPGHAFPDMVTTLLADNAALFLRRDRQSPLVVLPWETWERVLKWKT